MPDPYTLVIGLEVHVQLLTRTKLFCGCANKFGQPPNSATSDYSADCCQPTAPQPTRPMHGGAGPVSR